MAGYDARSLSISGTAECVAEAGVGTAAAVRDVNIYFGGLEGASLEGSSLGRLAPGSRDFVRALHPEWKRGKPIAPDPQE